jgi:hypothetical protein
VRREWHRVVCVHPLPGLWYRQPSFYVLKFEYEPRVIVGWHNLIEEAFRGDLWRE